MSNRTALMRERVSGIGTGGWHREVRVDSPAGPLDVDARLAPLLRVLWSRGSFETLTDCMADARSEGYEAGSKRSPPAGGD